MRAFDAPGPASDRAGPQDDLGRHHRPSRYGEFGFEIAGFWNEQYCSAKHPDTGQYPISQGDLLR